MQTLFLDAGHTAGKDPGACANGTTEHAEVAAIVDAVSAILPCRVVPAHLLLPAKIAWINKQAKESDILVSVHMNSASPKATGLECYFYGGSTPSRQKAVQLLKVLGKHLPLRDRGARPDTATRFRRLGIVRDTLPWAFLIELGFLTNIEDLEAVRAHGAASLVAALQECFFDGDQ